MSAREDKVLGPMTIALGAIVALAALVLFVILLQTVTTASIPFDRDEAQHAVDGWEVYHAVGAGSLGDIIRAVTGQSFYPPVHSLLIAISYALIGPGLAASRVPGVVALLLVAILLAWVAYRLACSANRQGSRAGPWLGAAGSIVAVSLTITSHVFVVNSVLVMLEMTGALLAMLLLALADVLDQRVSGRSRAVGLAGAATVAVLISLTKYSFGLFYVPALIASLITANWPSKASGRALKEAMAAGAICLGGMMIWALFTNRESMWRFFVAHPSYSPFLSTENLFFYPRAWLVGYSSNALIGALAVGLASIGTVAYWNRLAVRVALWSAVFAATVLVISTTNEARHMLPVATSLWLLAGLGFVRVLQWLKASMPGSTKPLLALPLMVALVGMSAVRGAAELKSSLRAEFEGIPAFTDLQRYALQSVDLDQPVLLVGDLHDQLGLQAMRWTAATLARRSTWEINIDYFPFERRERELRRANRKPQIATLDPMFPRTSLTQVLDREYFASVIEVRHIDRYSSPHSESVRLPLGRFPAVERRFEDWIVVIYDTSPPSNPPSAR